MFSWLTLIRIFAQLNISLLTAFDRDEATLKIINHILIRYLSEHLSQHCVFLAIKTPPHLQPPYSHTQFMPHPSLHRLDPLSNPEMILHQDRPCFLDLWMTKVLFGTKIVLFHFHKVAGHSLKHDILLHCKFWVWWADVN